MAPVFRDLRFACRSELLSELLQLFNLLSILESGLIRASRSKSAVTRVQLGSWTLHKTEESECSPCLFLCCRVVQAESVTETVCTSWAGHWGVPSHSAQHSLGRWGNVPLVTLDLGFPSPNPGSWKKPAVPGWETAAEGSLLVCVRFALTWNTPVLH